MDHRVEAALLEDGGGELYLARGRLEPALLVGLELQGLNVPGFLPGELLEGHPEFPDAVVHHLIQGLPGPDVLLSQAKPQLPPHVVVVPAVVFPGDALGEDALARHDAIGLLQEVDRGPLEPGGHGKDVVA